MAWDNILSGHRPKVLDWFASQQIDVSTNILLFYHKFLYCLHKWFIIEKSLFLALDCKFHHNWEVSSGVYVNDHHRAMKDIKDSWNMIVGFYGNIKYI